ncbi:N-acetylmuramoyl-L-alanine amidase [Clostridium butyricum]|nr:N-acetylmuramoyl-L-alanine amidase [Clostridium butyricum]MBZ5748656.1 N-acetylmuramoyl-L-alanine amidase [Clostridium butyricum]MDI9209534.1 N-acetylmuramoyl-L-alanine amidase [Clostridium butyricum]BBK77303.1 hypothetical protein Cbu04g_23110 [Clostridium butyricum]BBK77677.1 hypothetical protein Cbu04g_26850 [Clostridium butyricum]GEQ27738.1 hypothetical protein CBU03nite_41610 [Clostridium butyricum]
MKLIFSDGHTPSGTAGCGAVDIIDESICTREVGPLCVKYASQEGHNACELVVNHENSYNCEDCYTRVDQANNIGSDLFTEIHFNSGSGNPSGVEVLVNSMNSSAVKYAERVCEKISSAFNIPNRGVKVQRLIVLSRTNMPAMLVECHFVQEHDGILYDADKLARCIVGGILNKDILSNWNLGWNGVLGSWWYCTSVEDKTYYKSEWKLIDNKWYLFDSEGWCRVGWVKYITNSNNKVVWYYLDSDNCDMAIGWHKIDGDWFFFDNNGEMATGWIVDNGKDYYLYSTGQMAHDCEMYGYKFDSEGIATKIE